MRQRLALARGLLPRPWLLLLDEPTKGVDTASRAGLLRLLQDEVAAREGTTMLFTSHDLHEVEAMCERIAVLHAGSMLAVGTLDELRRAGRPQRRYDLRITGLPAEELHTLSARAGSAVIDLEAGRVSHLVLEVPRGEDGLARVLRSLMEGGAEVLDCTRQGTSLDQIVATLVSETEEPTGGAS